MIQKIKKWVLYSFSGLVMVWLLLLLFTSIKESKNPESEEERLNVVYIPTDLNGLDEAQSMNKLSIAKIDDTAKMLFVILSDDKILQLVDANDIPVSRDFVNLYKDFVRRFRPEWNGKFHFSVFAERGYEGFREDPEIQALGEQWYERYLAYYSQRINRLIVYPLLPDQRKVLRCG